MKKGWRERRKMPHEPTVRFVKGGAIVDDIDEYAGEVVGCPPNDFMDIVTAAQQLNTLAAKELLGDDEETEHHGEEAARVMDRMRDIYLAAAYSYSLMRNEGKGEIGHAFVMRAKQVAQWMKRPINPKPSVLEVLEYKGREIARQIAMRLFKGEGFVLVIFDENQGGFATWLASHSRDTTIKMLDELLTNMKEDQRNRS
jgi:hypothetical protein